MNLLSKVVIVLVVITGISCEEAEPVVDDSMGEIGKESGCDAAPKDLRNQSMECTCSAYGIPTDKCQKRLNPMQPNAKTPAPQETCCFAHYQLCVGYHFVKKSCKPTSKYQALVEDSFQKIKKDCQTSKDLCHKLHKTVDANKCKDDIHAVCEDYKWSPSGVSAVTLSAAVLWLLSVSFFISL